MCDIVDSLTNRLAVAISNRDAKAVAENVPCDDRIVYVSNGVPIRGNEYIEILSNYYQHLDSLSFFWEKKEFSFLVPNTVLMVGWAKISAYGKGIEVKKDEAVFTFVYHRNGSIWNMALAHKESL
jgi:ketosteroid isomerase-like protein